MKKVSIILGIISVLLLISTMVLGFFVYQDKTEIKNLNNTIALYEKQDKDYKERITTLEGKIHELNLLVDNTKNNNGNGSTDAQYEVLKALPDEIAFDKKIQGQEVVQYDDNYYVIIKMGMQNSGGYDINVTNVEINGNNVDIYVVKKEPHDGEIVTMAITYPFVAVKFNFEPIANVIYS